MDNKRFWIIFFMIGMTAIAYLIADKAMVFNEHEDESLKNAPIHVRWMKASAAKLRFIKDAIFFDPEREAVKTIEVDRRGRKKVVTVEAFKGERKMILGLTILGLLAVGIFVAGLLRAPRMQGAEQSRIKPGKKFKRLGE